MTALQVNDASLKTQWINAICSSDSSLLSPILNGYFHTSVHTELIHRHHTKYGKFLYPLTYAYKIIENVSYVNKRFYTSQSCCIIGATMTWWPRPDQLHTSLISLNGPNPHVHESDQHRCTGDVAAMQTGSVYRLCII